MNDKIKQVINHPAAIPVAVGVVSASVAGAAGYFYGFRRGEYSLARKLLAVSEESEIEGEVQVGEDADLGITIEASDLAEIRERWENESTVPATETVVSERILSPEEVRERYADEIEARAINETVIHEVSLRSDGGGLPGTSVEALEESYPQEIIDAAAAANMPVAEFAKGVEQVKKAAEREKRRGETLELKPPPEPEPVQTNVFANNTPGWDYPTEVASREGKDIYIIHADEYDANEEDFTQITLTYFAGDDIMAEGEGDSGLEIVPNYHRILGRELSFGHGSNDPNVFYVRNLEREAEYQVLRDSGHYTIDVMGLDIESERAATRMRRMRTPDDVET